MYAPKDRSLFTLAALTRFTGAKRRAVQLWAEAGAIRALPQTERSGPGVHRVFDRDEVIIACVIAALADTNDSPVGHLIEIGEVLRAFVKNKYTKVGIYKTIHVDFRLYLIRESDGRISLYGDHPSLNFDKDYLGKMDNKSYCMTVIYLNSCLRRLRDVPEFSMQQLRADFGSAMN